MPLVQPLQPRLRRDASCNEKPGFSEEAGLRWLLVFLVLIWIGLSPDSLQAEENKAGRTNVLLITVDDMNFDSLGCFGCPVPGISPNVDRLAREGMRFENAHVTIAVCQPCRSVWFTGRYPHRNGAEGFEPINREVHTLTESLRAAGYYNGIMAKVSHLTPQFKFRWDVVIEASQLRNGRDPDLYYQHAKEFFDQAKQSGRPFFLMANSQDPHRPFAGSAQEAGRRPRRRNNAKNQNPNPNGDKNLPPVSRTYKPEEVPVPKFLPDLPEIRQEMAEYFTSVHRADEIVGAVLRALEETGYENSTLVTFLSDHGMPLPFAKTNCYLNSTKTPWIVRWPGQVAAGKVDEKHLISGIDLTPTVLEALKLPAILEMDGRSFLPVLRGEGQAGRDVVYTRFHRTSGKNDYPMRSVVTRKFGYIYNAWADGKTVFRNESQNGLTFRAMRAAAPKDLLIAARVELFLHRVPEELYDYENDPSALHNLIDDPRYKTQAAAMRKQLSAHLEAVEDPLQARFKTHLQAEVKK